MQSLSKLVVVWRARYPPACLHAERAHDYDEALRRDSLGQRSAACDVEARKEKSRSRQSTDIPYEITP
jgi:hypothetical protein